MRFLRFYTENKKVMSLSYKTLLLTISKYTDLNTIHNLQDDIIKNIFNDLKINNNLEINNLDFQYNDKENKLILFIKKYYNCIEIIKSIIFNGVETIKIIKNNIIYHIDIYDYEIAFTNTKTNECIMYSIINDIINLHIDNDCIVISNE